ncbi:MAG: hypothetical protein QX195_09825 [Methylococcaceae bacterium]
MSSSDEINEDKEGMRSYSNFLYNTLSIELAIEPGEDEDGQILTVSVLPENNITFSIKNPGEEESIIEEMNIIVAHKLRDFLILATTKYGSE